MDFTLFDTVSKQHLDPLPSFHVETSSLLSEGEKCLIRGDFSGGMALFEKVALIAPEDSLSFFRQALSLMEFGSEEGKEKALFIACRKFKTSAILAPDHCATWHLWGNSLLQLGKKVNNQYFAQAVEKLEKALTLSEKSSGEPSGDIAWDLASAQYSVAQNSGEALDLHKALESFQKAAQVLESPSADFWKEYGIACGELAKKINDNPLRIKAISCFKQAISIAPAFYEGWSALATALFNLYEITHDEDHFSQANECYSSAAQIQPQNPLIWFKWAQSLFDSGSRTDDIKKVRSSVEKCLRAFACNPEDPEVIGLWGTSLCMLGHLTERLDLIVEGQNKISEAMQISPDSPELWHSLGISLKCLGLYFGDIDFYYQAIENLQKSVSTDRSDYRSWHQIAMCYSLIATSYGDEEALQLACRFFEKAIDLYPCSYYIFDYGVCLEKYGELVHQQRWLELSTQLMERALSMQKNAIYTHPDWLFHYACALDSLGDFFEETSYYQRAIEIFSHVMMIDPDYPKIHHRLALAYSHLGELNGEVENFYRAVHHLRLASKHDEDDDQIILDWAITLTSIAEHIRGIQDAEPFFRDAEHKLISSAKLGNVQAYYHLGCLYSLLGDNDKAMFFICKAEESSALPGLEELQQDEWLEGLRGTEEFRNFLAELEKKSHFQEDR